MYLALYKVPAKGAGLQAWAVHLAICARTLCRHSHGELVIDGVCHSSSVLDGGVRQKRINLSSGRWDVYALPGADKKSARAWFAAHNGEPYDWQGIARWALPFVRHNPRKSFCFEAIGAALGIDKPHKLHARKLIKYARKLQAVAAIREAMEGAA